MKPMKVLLAGLLLGASACTLAACKLPKWLGGEGDSYQVTITINGETQTINVAEDEIPERPADPVKDGYDFKGWYLDEACTQEYKFDKVLENGSTLYAYFTEKEYVITFVVDGVEYPQTFKWSQTPYFTPKKDGYVFKSWYLDASLTVEKIFIAPERAPLTVFAKFAPAYKVEYVISPDGENTDNNEIVETELETAPIRPNDPNLEGYTFEGWYMDADFKTECNFDTVLEPETQIFAKLTEKEYTITYQVGGTEDVLSTATYKYWSIPEEPATPTYQGQYFFGWYLDEEFKNSFDFSYTLKEDTVIYAQFFESKPIYTVEDLIAIAEYPAGNYSLQNDLTLGREIWTPIENFSGKFDGNGYKIYDFTIDTTLANSGFFTTNDGTIKNLTIEKFIFTSSYGGSSNVGALVGINNGTVENCTVNNPKVGNNGGITYKNHLNTTGSFTSNYGGLIGKSTATGIVKNCTVIVDMVFDGYTNGAIADGDWSTYSLYTYSYIGGAIGQNEGEISNLDVTFKLMRKTETGGNKGYTLTVNGQDDWSDYEDRGYGSLYVGGVAAYNAATGVITKSNVAIDAEVAATLGAMSYSYIYMGGFVQENLGTVSECYVTGKMEHAGSANDLGMGGFVRNNASTGTISDCYSVMDIVTNGANGKVGGFVANNVYLIDRSYARGSITSTSTGSYVGGFVAYSETNAQIKNSFTAVDVTANCTNMGAFVGGFAVEASAFNYCFYASDATILKGEEVYTSNIVSGVNAEAEATMYTQAFLNDLYWNYKVQAWNIDGTNAPKLLWEN